MNFMFLFLFLFSSSRISFGLGFGCLEILSEIKMNEINNLQGIIYKVLIFLKSNHTMTL